MISLYNAYALFIYEFWKIIKEKILNYDKSNFNVSMIKYME